MTQTITNPRERQKRVAGIYSLTYFGDGIKPLNEATLSIAGSAVLYGLSVYTVFPVHMNNGRKLAFRLQDHYQRLVNSCGVIGIDKPEWSLADFEKMVREVIAANEINEDVFVRATVHVSELLPGTRSRGLETTLSMFVYEAHPILPAAGARLKTSVWRRIPDFAIPSRAKVNGAYINSVLAKQDAMDAHYDDCIFLDTHGHVCELSAANIFLVRDGKLITPGTESDILEGINRKTVLELARELDIDCIERTVDLTELYVADEVFACGTSAYITPVIEVDARIVGAGKVGPITAKLREKYLGVLYGRGASHSSWLTEL